ncbi:cysteine-rich receptor-like protein kinase 25 [Quercus suber]|uniref:Cysteine-rich receptor-like protein kinase 25 n=1 Tax=Quercus suber TaxID=58331 RepID=A0AAW0J614_QUESU
MNVLPGFDLSDIQNITELHRFDQLVNTTLIDLVSQASEVPAGSKKFKTKEANFSEIKTIYSLVQCTPDLSTTDCKRCLRSAISDLHVCCSGKQGAKVILPSCSVRYEAYPFYKIIDTAPTPAPGLPPLPPREPEDKSQIPTVSIVAIVAPIVVSVVLFFLA